MAVYAGSDLDYAIERLSRLVKEAPEVAKELMKKNVYGRNGVLEDTGNLRDSIDYEYLGTVTYGGQTTDRYAIGPHAVSENGFPYGEVIMHGRGAVDPIPPNKYLTFHWRKIGKTVRSNHIDPWKPKTNFVLDTIRDFREWLNSQ